MIDVAAAFEHNEVPTRPAVREMVPLDAVLVATHRPAEVPWDELSELETQLLLRVEGRVRAMDIVNGNAVTPRECASELAALARRGLLRLEPLVPFEGDPLEMDLTSV
jgi:hypothetical protein